MRCYWLLSILTGYHLLIQRQEMNCPTGDSAEFAIVLSGVGDQIDGDQIVEYVCFGIASCARGLCTEWTCT